MSEVLLESVLVCPVCRFAKRETMPTHACQFFYECSNCKTLLRPRPGDCCVFCSYGSVKCPPMQDTNRSGRLQSKRPVKSVESVVPISEGQIKMKTDPMATMR